MNPLEPPKLPKKSKKVIFRDLKIRAGVLKVALKYFLLVLGQKISAGIFLTYTQEKSAIWAIPRPLLIGLYAKNRRGGHNVRPPFSNRVKLENIHLVQTFNFEKKYMWWIIFCVAGSLYLMLASTIVYFVIPLLVVIILYSRLVLFSHLKL